MDEPQATQSTGLKREPGYCAMRRFHSAGTAPDTVRSHLLGPPIQVAVGRREAVGAMFSRHAARCSRGSVSASAIAVELSPQSTTRAWRQPLKTSRKRYSKCASATPSTVITARLSLVKSDKARWAGEWICKLLPRRGRVRGR